MIVKAEQHLKSSTEEELLIHITFNPQNAEEEGYAALIATMVDLLKNYNRLNTLVDDDGV